MTGKRFANEIEALLKTVRAMDENGDIELVHMDNNKIYLKIKDGWMQFDMENMKLSKAEAQEIFPLFKCFSTPQLTVTATTNGLQKDDGTGWLEINFLYSTGGLHEVEEYESGFRMRVRGDFEMRDTIEAFGSINKQLSDVIPPMFS